MDTLTHRPLPQAEPAGATSARVGSGPVTAPSVAAVPRPPQEASRLAALRAQQLLDTLPEQMFDDIVRVASNVCGTPIALISLVDEDRQWFKAKVGLQADQTPRDHAFCAHAILEPDRPLVVPDATQDPRFAHNPLVTGSPDIRLYAGAPIVSASGHALGTVCVIDHQPRELTAQQIDSLQALSRQVSQLIEFRRVTRNSVDSVQLQLLAKSEKLRDVQRQSEQRGAQLDRLLGLIDHALAEEVSTIEDSARALLERLDLREPSVRVHAQAVVQAGHDLKTRLGECRAEIAPTHR